MALISPDYGANVLNKNVAQVYPIVNELYRQVTGRNDIQAVDTNSFIALGQKLESLVKTEHWLNTLARVIGLTIDEYRAYKNKFSDLARNQMEWGAIVQKITAEMPEAVMDKAWDVGQMDGQSIDQWIINNPKVKQVFFDKDISYAFFITMQTWMLKRAFRSEAAMASLITQIFGKVQNKIELTNENLARMAIANLVLNLREGQEFHLVTMFNNAHSGKSLTTATAKYDAEFLRYVAALFNSVSRKMESMSILYNKDKEDRFTPNNMQKLYVLDDFMTCIQTIPEYLQFSGKNKALNPDIVVPYWQASNKHVDYTDWSNVAAVWGTNEKGEEIHAENLVAILFDKAVVGTFRHEEDVLTTPVNARGRYYNTFWHEGEFYFNMSDENCVSFYLD